MKILLTSAILVSSLSGFAATVKITSFYYINNTRPHAELCGKVEDSSFPALVKVVVDPHTNRPGTYNTMVGSNGKFCVMVATWSGKAEALLDGSEETTEALVK